MPHSRFFPFIFSTESSYCLHRNDERAEKRIRYITNDSIDDSDIVQCKEKQKRWQDLTDVKICCLLTQRLKYGNLFRIATQTEKYLIRHDRRNFSNDSLSNDNVREDARVNARDGNARRMDEPAITPEPIRKRAKIGNKCDAQTVDPTSFPATGIARLPVELVFEIFTYLSWDDLRTVRYVCRLFERLSYDPLLWRSYEVTNNELETVEIIEELKRMPLLKKLTIRSRADCDDILRQLSLTNKNLEQLHVSNCTGSTSKLYLHPGYLIRILERCRNLHTINILGSRFRGRKFYRLLGDMGTRLRSIYTPATESQFCTFIKHARQISENDRQTICSMYIGANSWAPLYYFVTKRAGRVCTALISYLHNDILLIDANRPINPRNANDTGNRTDCTGTTRLRSPFSLV